MSIKCKKCGQETTITGYVNAEVTFTYNDCRIENGILTTESTFPSTGYDVNGIKETIFVCDSCGEDVNTDDIEIIEARVNAVEKPPEDNQFFSA